MIDVKYARGQERLKDKLRRIADTLWREYVVEEKERFLFRERRTHELGTYCAAALMLTRICRCSTTSFGIHASRLVRLIFCMTETGIGQDALANNE